MRVLRDRGGGVCLLSHPTRLGRARVCYGKDPPCGRSRQGIVGMQSRAIGTVEEAPSSAPGGVILNKSTGSGRAPAYRILDVNGCDLPSTVSHLDTWHNGSSNLISSPGTIVWGFVSVDVP